LVEEIAAISDQVESEVYDFVADESRAQALGVDKIPAIAVLRNEAGGVRDYGVRFYGIPAGYEFVSLLHAIKVVAAGKADLKAETLEALSRINEPVHIQVFVTPTCPYCQHSVMLAHQMAVAGSNVQAAMVEAQEFPQLAIRYKVMGVPRTVINETVHVEGAAPEATILAKLQEALSSVGA
jgi:glutaredoxin-like protein